MVATSCPSDKERTEIHYGQENAMTVLLQAMANVKKEAVVCSDAQSPAFSMGVEPVKKGYQDFKKRGVRVRQIVEITKDNIEYCKEFMNYVELRHLDSVKGNIAISETEYVATATLEGATPVNQTIYSNVKVFLEQQRYFFETLWNKAIPADQRIRALEKGMQTEETVVIRDTELATAAIIRFLENSEEEIDLVLDSAGPALAIDVKSYRNGLVSARERGVKIRIVTEITNDNLGYCKEIMSIADLRHLQEVKGNFAVSEHGYMATASLNANPFVPQVIHSNATAIVQQQQFVFLTLWNTAAPAEQRIREMQTGLPQRGTRIVNDAQEIGQEIEEGILSSKHWSICSGFGGLELGYKLCVPAFKKALLENRNIGSGVTKDDTSNLKNKSNKGIGHDDSDDKDKYLANDKRIGKGGLSSPIRWITNFDKNGIDLVKFFLSLGISIRYIREVPLMQFGVGDKKIIATVEEYEGGGIFQTALISNEPNYVKHYNILFEELWRKSVDARERINEIEEGIESEFVEVITDGTKAGELLLDLAKSVTKEAQLILTHPKAMDRAESLGIWDYLITAANNGAHVRVVSPLSNINSKLTREILSRAPTIKIVAGQQVDAGLFVADNKRYVRLEVKNVEADNISSAISRIIYSNSKIGIRSFKSFFEILWQQIDLYEELRIHDKMQTEFANIAAHELRTPVQPILGVVDMLKFKQTSKGSSVEKIDGDNANDSTDGSTADRCKVGASVMTPLASSSSEIGEIRITASQLGILDRNARRLQRLSSEILDATRIEAGTLKLDKEMFDIHKNVRDVVAEATSWIPAGQNIEIRFQPAIIANNGVIDQSCEASSHSFTQLPVIADKLRIFEVVSNLIRNAIKFSDANEDSKIITISTEKKEIDKEVIVSVKDQGVGISAEMMPLLFTKFATEKEKGGIGLGLFIAKNIVEAHDGRIWGKNNIDGKGATFAFTLPLP